MRVLIQAAANDDLDALRELERAAGQRFREVGLAHVADDEPPSVDDLARYAADDRAWVARLGDERTPAGYLLLDVVDGCAHVEQVSVHPDRQNQGIGRALMAHAVSWAEAGGRPAITLTTFDQVPWNRSLYEHLGYRVLAEHELGPGLRDVRAVEAVHGLDPALRVCMRLDLPR